MKVLKTFIKTIVEFAKTNVFMMKALKAFVKTIVVAVLMMVNMVFNGYTLSVLWRWFIVPTFGLPQLSLVPAIGVFLVINYLTYQWNGVGSSAKPEASRYYGAQDASIFAILVQNILISMAKPLAALTLGCIINLLM